jgi:hypothetical protein
MFSGGRSIYGLGDDAAVASPEPDPPAPAGTIKKAEVPGSPATPPIDAKTGAPLPNGGTEKDMAFYMKWLFWASLGGAAVLGTTAYFLLRKKPSARPVSGAAHKRKRKPAEDRAYGYTFAEWLRAAGRSDSASEYDLRAAWRAGEKPAEYRR